ncbi:protein NLRC5-like [Acanthaster planci]|uniref:Protein NLRC5-like n=1 Tax=Acanthaster planci TaxID=133434 RepID=A0A8B7YN42_ACAPL|nr:protein NLRC5-like [Acanthaster planci]
MQPALSEVKLRRLASNLGSEWKALATHLGIRRDEVDRFQADHRGTEEQIFQMLMIWWQRWKHQNDDDDKDCLRLLQVNLVKISRSDLAESLSEPMECLKNWNTGVCCAAFVQYYKDMMGVVPLLPWLPSDVSKINYIYMKPTLIEKKQKAKGMIERDIGSYEDMLCLECDDGQPVRFILLYGIAGSGKTTIVSKIATDWALKKSGSPLSKFSLLISLSMRELKRTPNLSEAIFDQILAKDTEIRGSCLRHYLNSHANEVLVVLDGADEIDKEGSELPTEGDIMDIISNKILRGCTVIVTTRPHMVDKLCKLNPSFTRIEINGFRESEISEYIHRFFHGEAQQRATDLYLYLAASESLHNLAKIPMMLLLICLVWSEGQKLPETLTELFTEAVFFIMKRYFLATGKLSTCDEDEFLQNELKDLVQALGRIALEGLMLSGQKLIFEPSDFGNPAVVEKACKVGILSQERMRSKLRTVQCVTFIHKTFQEAIAGFYWATLVESNRDLFDHYFRLIPDDWKSSTLEYVFRFCCGANAKAAKHLLAHVVSSFSWDSPRVLRFDDYKNVSILDSDIGMRLYNSIYTQTNLCLLMHLEAQNREFHSLMNPVFKNGLSFDLKCSTDIRLAFAFLIECASVGRHSFLTLLKKINIESIDKDSACVVARILRHSVIATDVELEFHSAPFPKNKNVNSDWQFSMGDALGSMQSLKTLSLYCRPFPVNLDLSPMFRCFAQSTTVKLECFALQGCEVDPRCLKQFFGNQDKLFQLGLSSRSLVHLKNNDHFWIGVFEGLQTQSLRVLEISFSKHTGTRTVHLHQSCPDLQVLRLVDDGLHQEDLLQICALIQKAPPLQEIDLSGSKIREAFPSLAKQLPKLIHLEVLKLNDTGLLSDQVIFLANEVLPALSNLRVLSLSRSYHHFAESISPDSLLSVVRWSCNSSSLKELGMKGCVMHLPHRNEPQAEDTGNEVLAIGTMHSSTTRLCSLEILDLHRNYLGQFTPQLIKLLRRMPALRILDMNSMGLTDSDAVHLAEVLPNCQRLQELKLEGNDDSLGEVGVKALQNVMRKLPGMKNLYMNVLVEL